MPALIFVRALGLLVLGQTESLPALINDTAAAVESLPRPVPHPAAADATSRILGMDPTLFWGLVATAVACVVGIIVAVCLYRRTASKRQIEELQEQVKAIADKLGVQVYAGRLPSASPPVRDPFKLGLTAMEQCEWDEAIGHFKDALKHASGTQLVALFNLIGICHHTPGRWPEAFEAWEESERLARQFKDREGEAAALGNIGFIYLHKGELDKALEYQEKAQKVFIESEAKREQASALCNIGIIYRAKGELDKALEYQERSLAIRRGIGDKQGEALSLGNIGLIWQDKGELDKALEYLQKALGIQVEIGDKLGQARQLGNIGTIYLDKGELDKALEYQEKAQKVFTELEAKQEQASALCNIGNIYIQKGELDKALEYQEKAQKVFIELEAKRGQASVLGNIGNIYRAKGELDKALEQQLQSLRICQEVGFRKGAATALVNMGSISILKMDWRRAATCYVPALMEHIAMGVADGPRQCLIGLRMCYTALGERRFVELCVEAGMEKDRAEAMVQAFEKKKPDSAPAQ